MTAFRYSTAQAADTIDAALFTGDGTCELVAREELREQMSRWTRQLEVLDSIDRDNEGVEG